MVQKTMEDVWEVHNNFVKEQKRIIAKNIDELWRDSLSRIPNVEDDSYIISIFNSARDTHTKLFDTLNSITKILQKVESYYADVPECKLANSLDIVNKSIMAKGNSNL